MQTRKILVGLLLLGALVVFALATFYIENWQFYVQDGYKLNAQFSRALELKTGDEVRIAGVEVGRVHSISVNPQLEKPVEIVMWIRRDTEIREADIAAIRMRSVFGGSFMEISRVDRQAPLLDDGDTIVKTHVSLGVTDLLEKGDDLITELLGAAEDVRTALNNVASITDKLDKGEGSIGKLLTEDTAYNELRDVLSDADRVLKDLAQLTENVVEGRGIAGRLFADEELAQKLEESVTDVNKFTRMLSDMIEDLPESSIGKLASDDELYIKLRNTLDGLEDTMAAISESRGTVGRIINDPELYDKLIATVDGVQEIVNSYREQSPILTFAGAVFGAM